MSIVMVIVSGETGSGKSAICGEIEIALKAIGLPVIWNDQGEKRMTHADWQSSIDLYRPEVKIIEQNISHALTTGAGQTRAEIIEECAKVADDHTPAKFDGTLAAHITGKTIAASIRALGADAGREGS